MTIRVAMCACADARHNEKRVKLDKINRAALLSALSDKTSLRRGGLFRSLARAPVSSVCDLAKVVHAEYQTWTNEWVSVKI